MKKRTALVGAVAAAVTLAGGAYALGGGGGVIWDDGHAVQPGSLDDGKSLLPQATITLAHAVAAAQRAQSGQLGQVDLKQRGDSVQFVVDVGSREVSVDADDGSVVSNVPQD
jgi:uncharacterized membrane protein YkoI